MTLENLPPDPFVSRIQEPMIGIPGRALHKPESGDQSYMLEEESDLGELSVPICCDCASQAQGHIVPGPVDVLCKILKSLHYRIAYVCGCPGVLRKRQALQEKSKKAQRRYRERKKVCAASLLCFCLRFSLACESAVLSQTSASGCD